jgi:hypothetical protein
MPAYACCIHPLDAVWMRAREKVAKAITDVRCRDTGGRGILRL